MRLGLIARDEIARGIAIQSKGFYDHMPVDRVLLVRMPRPDCELGDDWYPGATIAGYDATHHQLDEGLVRRWLDGLDVVFTVETPNDWRMPGWCREMGVKLVIQGNPEFYNHHLSTGAHKQQPDQWWWPTRWLPFHSLPEGPHMPVPMADDVEVTAALSPVSPGPLRVLHVVGKRAWQDRNGTDLFVDALRSVQRRVHVSLYGLDGEFPRIDPNPNVTVDAFPSGVTDRWAMYRDQHVLVLPRRYGGLCLPALEAMASGLAVVMPDCPPNGEFTELRIAPRDMTSLSLPCGPIRVPVTNRRDIAQWIDNLADSGQQLRHGQATSLTKVPRWSVWRQKYIDALEALL